VIDRPGNSARLHTAIAREADAIITVSETSKAKILEILKVPPERVAVTYQPAPTPKPLPQEDAEWLVSTIYRVTPGAYALYLGAVEPKKNLRRLIEAFIFSKTDIPLIMAGPLGWLYEEEQDLLNLIAGQHGDGALQDIITAKLGSRLQQASAPNSLDELPVRHLGYLPRRHITALLQCAKFFVFPSLYEGFGLPALEAMQFKIPVLTSRTGSLCEVVGDSALLVDPLDTDDIARGIRQLNADSDLRADLSRRGPIQAAKFSEKAYAHRLREAYAKVGVNFPRSVQQG
jgi:glycosyltransferase involved in cell wall biosynthesis